MNSIPQEVDYRNACPALNTIFADTSRSSPPSSYDLDGD
jgi:hypothetical protein